ncbi:MAG: amidohydrolase [Lewinella sp.]|nr:amidohydrolase [Lewinella sp.]
MKAQIHELARSIHPEVVGFRRHLHQHPELSFAEHETARYIAARLREWQIPHQYPFAETGVVALIEGGQGPGPVVALRADTDALPIQEENDCAYRSQNEGVMHACGHDVHTSSLLGTARILWTLRAHFAGTVKLIFQPAEEKAPGGASIMIKEGVLENPAPRTILAQHVHPPLEVGKVGFRPGIYMASADEIYLTVKGRGGHGAMPHDTVDPIAVSAQLITALQQLVSRQANPTMPSVLTFGYIASDGGATNVIPSSVRLKGTFRTFDEDWRNQALASMERIIGHVAAAFGATVELDVTGGYPYLRNDEVLTERARAQAEAYLGAENVVELPIRMTGEDFSFYSQVMPACFYRLGTGNAAKGITSPVHTPTFDVDEDSLRVGSGLMAWLALQELAHN